MTQVTHGRITLCDYCALTRKHSPIIMSISIHKHFGGCGIDISNQHLAHINP